VVLERSPLSLLLWFFGVKGGVPAVCLAMGSSLHPVVLACMEMCAELLVH